MRIYKIIPVYLLPVFLFLVTMNLNAQEKTINRSNQQWVHYFCQLRLSENWMIQGDTGYRWRENFSSRAAYLFRLGTGYRLTPYLQLAGGIAFSGIYGPEGTSQVEFRPYQDVSLRSDFRHVNLIQRFRLEERFYNPVVDGRIEGPNTFNFRLRYGLTAHLPLLRPTERHPDTSLTLVVGDEIFLNAGKEIITEFFDANRFMIGPNLQWSRHFSMGLIWSTQFASTAEPSVYRSTQVVWLQLRHHFDIRNKTDAL